jgi:hypothetical protein
VSYQLGETTGCFVHTTAAIHHPDYAIERAS